MGINYKVSGRTNGGINREAENEIRRIEIFKDREIKEGVKKEGTNGLSDIK